MDITQKKKMAWGDQPLFHSGKIGFQPPRKGDFLSTVKTRVEEYFKNYQLSRHGNWEMALKSLLLFSLYLVTYISVFILDLGGALLLTAFSLIGFLTALIGFNFSHDVMHGACFSKPFWNRFFSYVFDFNGTSSFIWKITHNTQHHTYTNIPGLDEDIDKAIWLRLSPKDALYPFHRFQPFYASFLYTLTSLNWIFYADYKYFLRYFREGKIGLREGILFFLFKGINLTVFLLMPAFFLSASLSEIVIAFFCLHFSGGFLSALVFQLAHIVEGVRFPFPDDFDLKKLQWAEHELYTTSNFATKYPWCGFFFGGLNYQIEHHLFTHVCHVHYRKIAPIVKKTALEFGLPYQEQSTFLRAILSHLKTLRQFGRGEK